jgi:hypothetical protein
MTVTDFRPAAAGHNALVATEIDVSTFWEVVLGAYSRLAGAMGAAARPAAAHPATGR